MPVKFIIAKERNPLDKKYLCGLVNFNSMGSTGWLIWIETEYATIPTAANIISEPSDTESNNMLSIEFNDDEFNDDNTTSISFYPSTTPNKYLVKFFIDMSSLLSMLYLFPVSSIFR